MKAENRFPYTDGGRRYFTYEYYVRSVFGERVGRIPIDAGFTCPNIDGKLSTGGCIYCKNGSAFANGRVTISEQYDLGRAVITRKWSGVRRFLIYLQAHTNTYGAPERVAAVIDEALSLPDAAGIIIGTRADCLPPEIVAVIAERARKTYVSVELGLQTSDDATAVRINRAHGFAEFTDGYRRLREASPEIRIGVHIINGLPGESRETMLRTARDAAALRPDLVKLHLLHVLDGTPLADMYREGAYVPMEREDYVSVVCDQLELLPPETAVARLTGDGMPDELLAPEWSRKKINVLNAINKELRLRASWQGKYYRAARDDEAAT